MFGLRRAGVLGASVALAGGVAYVFWNYSSFSGEKKPETPSGRDGTSVRGKVEERKDDGAEPTVVTVAVKEPQVSEVGALLSGHTRPETSLMLGEFFGTATLENQRDFRMKLVITLGTIVVNTFPYIWDQ